MKQPAVALIFPLFFLLELAALAIAETDKVEESLTEVRGIKAERFSREPSVLGELPGPADLAEHLLRCRAIPKAQAATDRNCRFDSVTKKRAAGLAPKEHRKAVRR